MPVAERIRERGSDLTAAERRVAEVVLNAPHSVGFGTVADLARAADVGAASVVRLAAKLGFDGYSELQQAVQEELTQQLRPAAERIHEADSGSLSEHIEAELGNVRSTLDSIDEQFVVALVERLADLDRPVAVVSGEASRGVAIQFASQLHQLRSDVALIEGSDVAVRRDIALLDQQSTVIVLELRRYEQWVLDAHKAIASRSIWTAGVTDSMLSPVAAEAEVAAVISARSTGPFDSYVGALALLNFVALEVAARLRDSATHRLAVVEQAWSANSALTDGTG